MAQVHLSAGNGDHHARDLLQRSDNARKDLNMDKLREEDKPDLDDEVEMTEAALEEAPRLLRLLTRRGGQRGPDARRRLRPTQWPHRRFV